MLLVEAIKNRLRNNKNALIAVIGETGSGKSYTALRLAELVDDDFSIDKVCFRPSEFVKAVRNARKHDVIVFDEAGVGIPAREWWSVQNRLLDYVIQTFRFKNLCVIFTMPNLRFIDEHVRLLFHYVLETQYIDYDAERVVLKPFRVLSFPRATRMYLSYPRIGGVVVRRLEVLKPSERLIKEYEAKKERYLSELYDEITQTLEPKVETSKKRVEDEALEFFRQNPELLRRFKKKTDLQAFIQQKWRVGYSKAHLIASMIFNELNGGAYINVES